MFTIFCTNSLSFSWIDFEFPMFWANWLSFSWIHYEFTIFLVNSLWMHCLFRKISLNLFSSLRILYGSIIVFRELTINSTFFHEFNINSFSLPQIQYIFTIFLANSLSFSWMNCKFTYFWEFTMSSPFFREFTINALFFREFTLSSPSFSRMN